MFALPRKLSNHRSTQRTQRNPILHGSSRSLRASVDIHSVAALPRWVIRAIRGKYPCRSLSLADNRRNESVGCHASQEEQTNRGELVAQASASASSRNRPGAGIRVTRKPTRRMGQRDAARTRSRDGCANLPGQIVTGHALSNLQRSNILAQPPPSLLDTIPLPDDPIHAGAIELRRRGLLG